MTDTVAMRRRFRRTELGWEEQVFYRILASLGLAAWTLVLWQQAFPIVDVAELQEKPVAVAKLILKPPPPPEPKKEEPPKPQPLPPRVKDEKPGPAPAPKQKQIAKVQKPAANAPGKPDAPPKRSVATMGLLSVLSSAPSRAEASSQRIAPSLRNVDFREARDLTVDVGSLTGSVGARGKATVGDLVAGVQSRGSGTQVVLKGSVVTPIAGPGGGASVSGTGGGASGRSLSEIRDIVAGYVAGLKYLYDKELKQRPSLHGKVTVEFVISGPGGVVEARVVSSALGHPSLESQIVGRIRGWKFPAKPGDATRVTFPFDFVPPTV